MATITAGGKITGLIGLTVKRTSGYTTAVVGDTVALVASYEVKKFNAATDQPLGQVIVQNAVRGVASTGDITVEARGSHVDVLKSGGAHAVGPVGLDATGRTVAVASPGVINYYGIALTAPTGAGQNVDVLVA